MGGSIRRPARRPRSRRAQLERRPATVSARWVLLALRNDQPYSSPRSSPVVLERALHLVRAPGVPASEVGPLRDRVRRAPLRAGRAAARVARLTLAEEDRHDGRLGLLAVARRAVPLGAGWEAKSGSSTRARNVGAPVGRPPSSWLAYASTG